MDTLGSATRGRELRLGEGWAVEANRQLYFLSSRTEVEPVTVHNQLFLAQGVIGIQTCVGWCRRFASQLHPCKTTREWKLSSKVELVENR